MRLNLTQLAVVNPECEYFPSGYDRASWQTFRSEVQSFASSLSVEFSAEFSASGESNIQDATYGAEIYLPSSLVVGDGEVVPCIRVSNHQKLFIVTVARRVSEDTEARIESVAERLGFTYTPEAIFGEPFDTRDRINGDLFNQLYDYLETEQT